jgi:hypothetical protein
MEIVTSEGEFPFDAKPGHVIVMPVNLQGIMDLGTFYRRFKFEFPNTYKKYKLECTVGDVYSGACTVHMERGYIIVLMYYKNFIVGDFALSETARLSTQFASCVTKLTAVVKSFTPDIILYSPPIMWPVVVEHIKLINLPNKWVTLKE